ncbi:MAG: ribosome silencing factor [Bacillota bacterium]|nr:ribosome silencing factor [Clostridiales bacterium]MDD6764525.1 ribosome silencing factor [Bacillota bacterium]MDY5606465.1 ribosome silencing factor [Lentihominibacter sp.]MCI7393030.1 ribosome silencing factor [Clostridiales bacterium]MDD6978908.1 ribosome silencing factor [Bacillota bacterium]
MNEERAKAEAIAKVLSDKKGMDVAVIDISPKASFADFFVLASGGSDRQVAALVESVEDLMEPQGVFPKSVEGRKTSGWILMDYGDVVVNVMTPEMREKYNIERIWGDCELTEVE